MSRIIANNIRHNDATADSLSFDSSGRVLIGTSTARSADFVTARIQHEGTSQGTSSIQLTCNSAASVGTASELNFSRSRGSAVGDNDAATNGDNLGIINFTGADGTDLNSVAAQIRGIVDADTGSNDMPGRLAFYTSSDGSDSPTERLRITSNGTIQLRNSPGIDFSQIQTNASGMTSETLDSYEEGTWDPVYNFSGSGDATVVSAGRYIKVGSIVHVQGYVYINNSNSLSGNALIAGLPFASSSSPSQRTSAFVIGQARAWPENHPYLRLLLEPNSTGIKMFNNDTSSTSNTRLTNSNFTAAAEKNIISFSGAYTV